MLKTVIVFLGLPGSGKGTQAQNLCKNFDIIHYSLGDLLRSYSHSNHQDSLQIKEMLSNGSIVPAKIVNAIVENLLKHTKNVCLLDGYPRNLEQANFLSSIGDLNVIPIYFHLDKNLLLERINNRIQCKSCSKVYNAKLFNSDAFYCDFCGDIECYKRSDDNINALNNRITQFEINTLPVLDFYQKLGVLHTINASLNIEQIKCEVNLLITKSGIDF